VLERENPHVEFMEI